MKKSQSGKATYCMIPTMTFFKRQNHGDCKNISGLLWHEGKEKVEYRGFLEQWKFYIKMMDTCHYIFVQTHRIYNTRVSLKTNSGQLCLSVGSPVVTNVPLWWVTLLMEDAMHVWGQGVYGKSLYLPFSFYEHKSVLKIMSLKIKSNNVRNYHRCQRDVSKT